MTWMVPRHRTTSHLSLSLSLYALFSSFPPPLSISLSLKKPNKREKKVENSFPPFLERESGSIERENAEVERLGGRLRVCGVWCALPCAIFVPPLKREWKLAGISGTVFPFLFCFFFFLCLGVFGLRSGEDGI